MTRHLHSQANALLYKALDLPPAQRQNFLHGACDGHPALLDMTQTLLARITQLDEFLESPLGLPAKQATPTLIVPQPGERIGKWRVLRELARGVAAVVLLVERHDGAVRQIGALKIVRHAGLAAEALARFHLERQRLASLSHPDLACLIDAGATADERPYFVMAYSEGVSFDQYCAEAALDLRARVALFARVCNAVHHAHQRLVLHRGLKPSTILLGADGTLKLIDFGVASLHDDAAGASVGQLAPHLTPQYASPEQLASRPLSISTDIYSLGAVLYGLLSGQSPYGTVTDAAPAAAWPAVTRASSAVLDAAARGPSGPALGSALVADLVLKPGPRLARQLRGDLEHILQKSVSLDPDQRYASAEQFKEDLERYLRHQPLCARPATLGYRLRKLAQRSPFGVAASTLAVLALLAGAGLASWQAREALQARALAEQRFEQTHKLAHAMLFEVNDALEQGPGAAREKLVATALLYLRKLAEDRTLEPSLRRDVAGAYERIGDIAVNQLSTNPARASDAQALYQQALRMREAAVRGASVALPDLIGLRDIHRRLGDAAFAQGRVADARRHYDIATEVAGKIAARANTPEATLELLSRRRYAAAVLYARDQPNTGELALALQRLVQLREDMDRFIEQHPALDALDVALPLLRQLADLQRLSGDLDSAQATALRALGLVEKKLAGAPNDPRWREQLALAQRQIGEILIEQGKFGGGLERLKSALAQRQQIAVGNGAGLDAVGDLALAHGAVGKALLTSADYSGAELALQNAHAALAGQLKANPVSPPTPAYTSLRAALFDIDLDLATAQLLAQHGAAAANTLKDARVSLADDKPDLLHKARVDLLEAWTHPAGAAARAWSAVEQAVPLLIKANEHDPLDTYRQRDSAEIWNRAGEIGLHAGQKEAGCAYLGLAEQRYDALEHARRMNASDQAARLKLKSQRVVCL